MRHHQPWDLTSPTGTLTTIIESSRAVIGDVIVAHVDLATQEVTGTRRLDPVAAPQSGPYRPDLEDRLRQVAQELAESRTFNHGRWRRPTGVFVTLVCREGRVVVTAQELAWSHAWLYSNHLTNAYLGEVYVVTPHGWLSCGGDEFGTTPRVGTRPVLTVLSGGRAGVDPDDVGGCARR